MWLLEALITLLVKIVFWNLKFFASLYLPRSLIDLWGLQFVGFLFPLSYCVEVTWVCRWLYISLGDDWVERETDRHYVCTYVCIFVHMYVYSHTHIYNIFSICTLFMKHLKKHFWERFFPLVPKRNHITNTSVTKKLKGKKRESNKTTGEGPSPLCDQVSDL